MVAWRKESEGYERQEVETEGNGRGDDGRRAVFYGEGYGEASGECSGVLRGEKERGPVEQEAV